MEDAKKIGSTLKFNIRNTGGGEGRRRILGEKESEGVGRDRWWMGRGLSEKLS